MNRFYRKDALKRLAAQEDLNKMIIITPSYSWAVIAAGGILVLLLCVWGAFGRIEHIHSVDGMYISLGETLNVSSEYTGIVDEFYIDETTLKIEKGDRLLRLRTGTDSFRIIYSQYDGILEEIAQAKGSYVNVGETLITMREEKGDSYADILIPLNLVQEFEAGMRVKVSSVYNGAGSVREVDGTITYIANSLAKDDLHNREVFGNQITQMLQKGNYVAARCILDEEDIFYDHTMVQITMTDGYITPFALLFEK